MHDFILLFTLFYFLRLFKLHLHTISRTLKLRKYNCANVVSMTSKRNCNPITSGMLGPTTSCSMPSG